VTMDFLERLVEFLNRQNYYATVVSPILVDGNSIAIMVMPSNDYEHYFDGSYRQGYAFQIMTKHTDQLTAYHTIIDIANLLENIDDIPSQNGSYEFENIKITTDPNVIGKDDKYYIYAAQFSADLFIKPKKE